jgi:hypothetical protein
LEVPIFKGLGQSLQEGRKQ